MTKLAISETTTYRWSFEEDVENFKAAGIEGIGVWRQKISDFGEERGIELLRDSGLSVSSLHWAGGFTGSDGRTYKDSLVDAREAIQLAARIGAGCLLVYSGGRAGHTHNHAQRLFRSALREMLSIARSEGVTLAIEPMHPACAGNWTLLTSLEQARAMVHEFSDAHLRLALDTYHVGHDAEALEHLHRIAPDVAVVHLGDAHEAPGSEQNRCLLGEGKLPLQEMVNALLAGGFDGCFEVELMGEAVEDLDYSQVLDHSKQAFQSWTSVLR